jgi:hypothetical protein
MAVPVGCIGKTCATAQLAASLWLDRRKPGNCREMSRFSPRWRGPGATLVVAVCPPRRMEAVCSTREGMTIPAGPIVPFFRRGGLLRSPRQIDSVTYGW